MPRLSHVYQLGIKELWGLIRDPIMLILIVYAFTLQIYTNATAMPETLNNAAIAFVDEDASPLSERIIDAFRPPYFSNSQGINLPELDAGMDAGQFTFALVIPPGFQRDVLAGRSPTVQLNVDATRMTQAFTGSVYVQKILLAEVNEFVKRYQDTTPLPVDLAVRVRFNPNLTPLWFGAVMEVMNMIVILSIVLSGAALIREREHGTIEHLLVMPVTPSEIMLGKVWSMGLVVLASSALSLHFLVQGILGVPVEGSVLLFIAMTALFLFSTTAIGIFLATIARSMPQFGLLIILVLLPMLILSGSLTPQESMPQLVQYIMEISPTTHFVTAAQAILYRGAGLEVVWPQLLALSLISIVFFTAALVRFRKTIAQMA